MQPSAIVRAQVMARDESCVACHQFAPLEFQHRQASGMGGSRHHPLTIDGVAACPVHNARFESDLQLAALVYGWKVRGWVTNPEYVPVLYWGVKDWAVLTIAGGREWVPAKRALALMGLVYGDEEYAAWVEVLREESHEFGGKKSCDWLPVK